MNRRDMLKIGAIMGGGALAPRAFAAVTPPRFSWTLRPAASAGFTHQGLANARETIRRNIDNGLISGAVTAVARHGILAMFDAQGWADIEARRPMRPDSLFRMMSSTKVVTAVALMMMVEEGRIALEDPISKFIPTFHNQRVAVRASGVKDAAGTTYVAANRDITVKDLLTHTSGLSSNLEGIVPELDSLKSQMKRTTLASSVPSFGRNVLEFQPGTRWNYSPLDGMDTLLYLVELVSRTPAERFLRERIFQPLDMRSSTFHPTPAQRKRMVNIYAAKDGKLTQKDWLLAALPDTYVSGAGGLVSDAHDMLNFELMLLNGGTFNDRRLLKRETVEKMSRNQVGSLFADWIPPITGGNGFGLGVRVVEDEARGNGRSKGAFGWGGAYGTETWADPALDMACVFLIQMDSPSPTIAHDFTRALRQAIVA